MVARLLAFASTASCLIVTAGFVLFVVNQTSAASARQQEAVRGSGNAQVAQTSASSSGGSTGASTGAEASGKHVSMAHRVIDEAAEALRSPFARLTSSTHSQWAVEIVGTILSLLLYGFLARFLVRTMRVRI